MLTAAQLAVLKADIAATPALAGLPMSADGHLAIAAHYNQPADPPVIVWRTNIATEAVKRAVVWTEYIARSEGERSAFELIISDGVVNAADANIRQGFADIFSGATGVGTRTALVAIAKRNATRAEALFAEGTGTDAAPATMTFEGTLSVQDIERARNS